MRIRTRTVDKIDEPHKELFAWEVWKKEIIRGLLIFWLVSTVFLFLRIVLRGLGSNPDSLFAGFIYLVSGFFLLPFYGIFPQLRDEIIGGRPSFDPAAFTAIFCYTILVLLAMAVVAIGVNMFKTRKQMDETVEKDNPIDPSSVDNIVR